MQTIGGMPMVDPLLPGRLFRVAKVIVRQRLQYIRNPNPAQKPEPIATSQQTRLML
jgi:hypothetical protein